jgi:hypothetical protein
MDFLKSLVGRLGTWVAALGVGAVVALYDYVTAAKAAAEASGASGIDAMIHGGVLVLLVKGVGALVKALPKFNP